MQKSTRKRFTKIFTIVFVITLIAFSLFFLLVSIFMIIQSGAFVVPPNPLHTGPGGAYPMCFPTNGRITSFAPHGTNNLNAIDIANAIGTPIYAAHDGNAVCLTDPHTPAEGSYGIHVIITGVVTTIYGHMESCSVPGGSGAPVSAGDQIGVMGWTGTVIPAGPGGTHLHYGIVNGDSINNYIPPYDAGWYASRIEGTITTDDPPNTCYSRDAGGGDEPI